MARRNIPTRIDDIVNNMTRLFSFWVSSVFAGLAETFAKVTLTVVKFGVKE